jgi:hypothetical protein
MNLLIKEEDTKSIQETFASKFAHFISRTPTQYTTSPIRYLLDRGIENRLLDNLLAYLPPGAIIAGGFALNVVIEEKKASDIDIFFTSQAAFDKTVSLYSNQQDKEAWSFTGYTLKEGTDSPNSRYVSFTHPTLPAVQLMRMVWYADAHHVIDTFDFTISQFAFDDKGFHFNGEAMMDLAKKRLILHRMQFPASTLRRLIKYTHKGYYACPGSLVTICEAIQKFTGEPDINDVVYVD